MHQAVPGQAADVSAVHRAQEHEAPGRAFVPGSWQCSGMYRNSAPRSKGFTYASGPNFLCNDQMIAICRFTVQLYLAFRIYCPSSPSTSSVTEIWEPESEGLVDRRAYLANRSHRAVCDTDGSMYRLRSSLSVLCVCIAYPPTPSLIH
jgi:hypothetical protein